VKKIFKIGLDDQELILFIKDEGRKGFDDYVRSIIPKDEVWEGDNDADGLSCENAVFIEDISDLRVLLHEMSHYLDYLYLRLSCTTEREFKAYLLSNILEKVLNFREGQ